MIIYVLSIKTIDFESFKAKIHIVYCIRCIIKHIFFTNPANKFNINYTIVLFKNIVINICFVTKNIY